MIYSIHASRRIHNPFPPRGLRAIVSLEHSRLSFPHRLMPENDADMRLSDPLSPRQWGSNHARESGIIRITTGLRYILLKDKIGQDFINSFISENRVANPFPRTQLSSSPVHLLLRAKNAPRPILPSLPSVQLSPLTQQSDNNA